jgi:hypothetical protein
MPVTIPLLPPGEVAPSAADRLRTVTITPGGRVVPRVNLEDPTAQTFYKERDTFKIVPPTKAVNWSRSSRRLIGQVESGESMDNWTILATWWVKGLTANEVLQNVEQLMAEIDDPTGLNPYEPKLMEWRPSGATNSSFFELRGTGLYVPTYSWIKFTGALMMRVDLSWPIAPLALGLPLDIEDGFTEDSREDYTVDKGLTPDYASGPMGLTFGNEEVLGRHTVRNYVYDDCECTTQWNIPTGAVTPAFLAAVLSVDTHNYVEARWTLAGNLELVKIVGGGAAVSMANVAAGVAPTGGQLAWVRARIEGNAFTGELFLSNPGPMASPTATISYAFTAVEAAVFGFGHGKQGGYHKKT